MPDIKIDHTPLPWRVDRTIRRQRDGAKFAFREIASASKAFWIAKVQAFDDDPGEYEGNADFIVRAANNHYKLLEALKASLPLHARVDQYDISRGCREHCARCKADAAIAAAESEVQS